MESNDLFRNCLSDIEQEPEGSLQQMCLIAPVVERVATRLQRKYDLNDSERADLVQDATVGCLSALRTYDSSIASLSTYLHTRARGEMLDSLRKLRSGGITGNGAIELADQEILTLEGVNFDPEDELPDGDLLESVPTEHASDDPVLGAEIAQMLDRVDRLPLEDKMIIAMRFGLYGTKVHTLEEIARLVQLTAQGVLWRVNLILKGLA